MQNWIFDIRSRTFVLLTVSFLVITAIVHSGITESFDQGTVLYFYENTGNSTLDDIMQVITETGDAVTMLGFGIIILIVPKTRRIGITLMILIVISTLLTGYIKCGVDRDRPDFEYEGTPFPVSISKDTFALFCEGGFDASYPSGHAARSMIFAVIFGYAISERFSAWRVSCNGVSCPCLAEQTLCAAALSYGCNWGYHNRNNACRCNGKEDKALQNL